VRLGLFGGTFDPPHIGHLLVAVDAIETLGLDQLILIPAAEQPLKVGIVRASAADRLEMVRRMAGDDPRFRVDPIEIERPGLSYTVDTLAEYAVREPSAERFFLVGADVMESFEQWREPHRVLELAQMVVLQRSVGAKGEQGIRSRFLEANQPRVLRTRTIDISSTEIRGRVGAGRSIRGFVPDAVAEYIAEAGLYR
jgi:nicotinate-nucleotide adenylyltransferase